MDNMKILKRAWYILWNYRALWIFGLILALTIGGTSNYRFNGNRSTHNNQPASIQGSYQLPWDSQTFSDPQKMLSAMEKVGQQLVDSVVLQHEVGALIGFVIAFFLLALLVSVGMTILRYVSETALIQMVDGFEDRGEKLTVKQGFRLGWSRTSWHLFLVDLLIGFVPGLVMLILLGSVGWGIFSLISGSGSRTGGIILLAVLAGLVFLFMLVFGIYFVLVSLLRNFIVRAIALEKMGVWEAVRRGFALVQRKWKDVGLFWLVMIGLGIAWWVGSFILLILLIPFFLVTILLGALLGSVPGLVVGSISSLFLTGYWPVVVGVLFGLPLFILLAALPLFVMESFAQVFRSTSWTLVFRELRTMETGSSAGEPVSGQ